MQSEAERIAAMREVLRWYANFDNYQEGLWVSSSVQGDRGARARAILQRFPATESRGTPEV